MLCIVAIGCKSSPVAGTWISTSKAMGFSAISFANDGTFEATDAKSVAPVFSGTWEVKDNQISMTVDHSKGAELGEDSQQSLSGSLSKGGKQIVIGSAVFNRQ